MVKAYSYFFFVKLVHYMSSLNIIRRSKTLNSIPCFPN